VACGVSHTALHRTLLGVCRALLNVCRALLKAFRAVLNSRGVQVRVVSRIRSYAGLFPESHTNT